MNENTDNAEETSRNASEIIRMEQEIYIQKLFF